MDGFEEGYKRTFLLSLEQNSMKCGPGRRKRRHKQREGILPAFLNPAAIAAAKAATAGAISAGSSYGTKKAIDAATRKKRVGKISAAQWEANKRQAQRMLSRRGVPSLEVLRLL